MSSSSPKVGLWDVAIATQAGKPIKWTKWSEVHHLKEHRNTVLQYLTAFYHKEDP